MTSGMKGKSVDFLSDEYVGISKDMLNLYLRLAPEYLHCLQSAGENRNVESVRFYAHKLASVLGVMGFSDLRYCVAKLEDEALELSELDTLLGTVSSQISESIMHLVRYQ